MALTGKRKDRYFINQLTPGKECIIKITKENGSTVRFVTLTEEESDHIWKGTIKGKKFVAITNSSLIYDNDKITLIDDQPNQQRYGHMRTVISSNKHSKQRIICKQNFVRSLRWKKACGYVQQKVI